MIKKYKEVIIILIMILAIFGLFMLLHKLSNTSMFEHTSWDSYDLQAEAWLNGKNYLDGDYPHLELAIYKDHYYVSFPPFPSVIMLPFVLIMGRNNVPDNFIIFCVVVINTIIAYRILRRYNTKEIFAVLLALGLVVGCNLLSMAMSGGPWFIAQALNILLCTMAVGFLLKDKRAYTYTCLALAVRV